VIHGVLPRVANYLDGSKDRGGLIFDAHRRHVPALHTHTFKYTHTHTHTPTHTLYRVLRLAMPLEGASRADRIEELIEILQRKEAFGSPLTRILKT
jgi:hypothetical protein